MGGRQATGASAPTATTAPVITSTTTLSPLTCRSHGSPGATQVHAEGRWGCGVSVTALATNTRCAATVAATAGRSGRSKSNCGRSRPSFRSQRSTPGSIPTAARVDAARLSDIAEGPRGLSSCPSTRTPRHDAFAADVFGRNASGHSCERPSSATRRKPVERSSAVPSFRHPDWCFATYV